MRFEDERYVRLYTRDTTTWLMLPWQSKAILPQILRKVDRAGIIDLGADGLEALAVHIQFPLEIVEAGMPPLLKREVLVLRSDGMLVWPRYIEAQEAVLSDRARQKAARERARDLARAAERGVTLRDDTVTPRDSTVTLRDETVTRGHAASRAVTLNCAVLNQPIHTDHDAAEPALVTDGSERTSEMAIESEPKAAARKRMKPTSRGSRLPDGWTPSAEVLAWAAKEGIRDPLGPLEEFADYWRGVSGQKGVKTDWDATYRNRLRQLVESGRVDVRKPVVRPVPTTATERKPPISPEERSAALKMLDESTPQLFRDVMGGNT